MKPQIKLGRDQKCWWDTQGLPLIDRLRLVHAKFFDGDHEGSFTMMGKILEEMTKDENKGFIYKKVKEKPHVE